MNDLTLPSALAHLAPVVSGHGRVAAAWIDHHGHMNVGYYGVAIDAGLHGFSDRLAMGAAYRETTNCGFFALESHQTFKNEMLVDEGYLITCHLIDWNAKLMHIMAGMYRTRDGVLAATAEYLWGHVDRGPRRVVPFPEDRLAAIAALAGEHTSLTPPVPPGLAVAIKKK